MRDFHRVFLGVLILVLLQGCEDDPILEPSPDGGGGGGGSYGNLAPLSDILIAELRESNLEIF
ncbi:MAG: hypothetical protein WD766_14900 [Gemmatimonadota bacterium]